MMIFFLLLLIPAKDSFLQSAEVLMSGVPRPAVYRPSGLQALPEASLRNASYPFSVS